MSSNPNHDDTAVAVLESPSSPVISSQGLRPIAGSSASSLLPESPSSWTRAERYAKVAVVAAAASLLMWTLGRADFWRFHRLPSETALGFAFWVVAVSYGCIVFASLIWRLILWQRYRAMPSVDDSALPSVTVVIPAFNEGELVRYSIQSAARSAYPSDKLEIIVVDDGSTDDTWEHIQAAVRSVCDEVNIRARRQRRNLGKRQALYYGFKRAAGEVFVTIDSDSVLEPDALRNAVSPLVRQPEISCVAGCVQVLNPRESLLSRFMKCYYSMSFKFVRAYQSEFRGVFCTPGALSVYRASMVRKVMDEWLNQHFLGLPCATGEDRAMTNLLLREGSLTAYQGNAVVWSRAPHLYRDMVNMFLRWARSNIRETLFLWQFMFTRFRDRHLNVFRLNMAIVLLSLIMPPLLIAHSAALAMTSDGFVARYLGVMLIYAGINAVIYFKNERDSDWTWLLAYNFFWIGCLSWILPYAAMTLRNTAWLTRGVTRSGGDAPAPPARGAGLGRLVAS